MTDFQLTALILAAAWLFLVVGFFRRSGPVLVGGLAVLGIFTLVEFITGRITAADLGLSMPASWSVTLGFALAGLIVALAYSPLADQLAARLVKQPPTLQAFGTLQHSVFKLVVGIIIAWILGGFLEELVARGIVLGSVQAVLAPRIRIFFAALVAVVVAALAAGLMHIYQGPRAVIIIAQLSAIFGVLFVVSGHNLWAAILCHGLYDTIAFIRFALKKSKYSHPEPAGPA
jgi:uncharacterized protein